MFRRTGPSPRQGGAGPLIRWVLLAALLTYLPLMRGHFFSVDEIEVYHQARSWWERGDFSTAAIQNTLRGRDGKFFAPYGVGQSLLALPFYGAGKALHNVAPELSRRLGGPVVGGDPEARWGGDVEIFVVLLLNCLAGAGLVALFAALQMEFGARPTVAVGAAVLLGFASFPAGIASTFYQHGLETLFLLWSFFFLYRYRSGAPERAVLLAGVCAGALVLVRLQGAVALPVLTLYLFRAAWERLGGGDWRDRALAAGRVAALYAAVVCVALLVAGAVNQSKWGEFTITGTYAKLVPFDTPLLLGLYGNLFSASRSIFLFSPLLFAAPWYFREFARRYAAESVVVLLISTGYLLVYSKAYLWHGMWCFGPRYLTAIVPLLMLPLGPWLSGLRRWEYLPVAVLALGGAVIAGLHIAVNVSYVYFAENWGSYKPEFGYLFVPQDSQIPAHWRGLVAMDHRVDLWLVNMGRTQGWELAAIVGGLLALGAALAWRRVAAEARKVAGTRPDFSDFLTEPLRLAGLAWCVVIVAVSLRNVYR